MTHKRKKAAALIPKNWWHDFFEPLVGEIMLAPRIAETECEVDRIIQRSKARPPSKRRAKQ